MSKAVLSMCLAIAIVGGGAALLFGDYSCPGSAGCTGTCPEGQMCKEQLTANNCKCV